MRSKTAKAPRTATTTKAAQDMDAAIAPDLGARERLVMAAARVFAESGYRAASLDVILRRSGVAKSNFYYHFQGGKLALACAAVDVWLEILAASDLVKALQNSRASGLQRLEGFVMGFETSCADGPYGCPFGMLAAEDDLEPPLRERLGLAFDRFEKGIADAIRAGVEDGSVRSGVDPERTAAGLLAAVQGAGLLGRASRCGARVLNCALPIVELIAASPQAKRR